MTGSWRRVALLCLLVAGSVGAPLASGADVDENAQERQVMQIAAKLRCAVCQSESVADSHAELAVDMRRLIAEKLAAGQSEAQIIDWFVARYGNYILMKPPAQGVGWPVWVLPPVLLLGGLLSVVIYIRGRNRISQAAGTPAQATGISEEDRARIAALRQHKAMGRNRDES